MQTSNSQFKTTLERSIKVLVIIGLLFFIFAFIKGFLYQEAPQKAAESLSTAANIVTAQMAAEELIEAEFQFKKVAVLRRTIAQQKTLALLEKYVIPHAQAATIEGQHFVFYAQEPLRHCLVKYQTAQQIPNVNAPWFGGFVNPCNGAIFDTAGRRYMDSGPAEQPNLAIPQYRWVKTGVQFN